MENNSWKASLNLSNEGKKKIHFLEEEDFFLKRGGKSGRKQWIDFIELQLIKEENENNSWKPFEGREEKNSLPEGGRFLFEEGRKMNRL